MTYRGQVKNGQITLDQAVRLPEGARVNVEVTEQSARISRPKPRTKLQRMEPLRMPGGLLADELVNDRRRQSQNSSRANSNFSH
jgi:hypothetical protein